MTKNENNDGEKKEPICHHFKKARCHHGMSGKQSYNGIPKCPFRHPMICQKLLRHGDRGRGGCRGKEAGCNEFHQVKMCYSSMNTKKCSNSKDCKNGYHVKGTILTKELKDVSPNWVVQIVLTLFQTLSKPFQLRICTSNKRYGYKNS